MVIAYQVVALQTDRPEWLARTKQAIAAELHALGLHSSLTVSVTDELLAGDAPALAVVLIGPTARTDVELHAKIAKAKDAGLLIIPVLESLANFKQEVPDGLSSFNGFEWSGPEPERRLAQNLLEQLDIEERDRMVFISHKRTDGLGSAEQLHDALTRIRFAPFIDRFAIPVGQAVQQRIADALERFAFLLVLETPEAHLSDWVFDEVDYALAHTMGLLILQWPNDPTPIPGTVGIPRLVLNPEDLTEDDHNYSILTAEALDRVLREIELAHASGLVRRRRMLLASVQEAAEAGGATCTALKNWRLDVEDSNGRTIIAVAPRLPLAADLQRLDEARNEIASQVGALLVHGSRRLEPSRKQHLQWAIGNRNLRMIPENAVGGVW